MKGEELNKAGLFLLERIAPEYREFCSTLFSITLRYYQLGKDAKANFQGDELATYYKEMNTERADDIRRLHQWVFDEAAYIKQLDDGEVLGDTEKKRKIDMFILKVSLANWYARKIGAASLLTNVEVDIPNQEEVEENLKVIMGIHNPDNYHEVIWLHSTLDGLNTHHGFASGMLPELQHTLLIVKQNPTRIASIPRRNPPEAK